MKKLLLILSFTLTSFLYSQNNTWMFSGELGFKNDNFQFTEDNSLNSKRKQSKFLARVGYVFINSNFEIGLGFGFSSNENPSVFSNNTDKFVTTTFIPYVKQYFTINDKFAFHLIGELGFTKSYMENSSGSDEIDIKEYGIVLRPGLVYFISKHFALNANLGSMGYINTTSRYKNSSDTKNESFGFNFNSSNILLGIAYYL